MFPDVSELIRVMKEVVGELQKTQECMQTSNQTMRELIDALEA